MAFNNATRVYKGTLRGGLLLDENAAKKQNITTIIGVVIDDISKDSTIKLDKMKAEHYERPEHFGILQNDRVQAKESDIVEDIF